MTGSSRTASESPAVRLANPGHRSGLGLRPLRRWLEAVLLEVAPEASSLGVLLTGDRRIRSLNLEYRGMDSSTDVLSFPGESTPEGLHLGDIVISVDTARRQAEELGHPLSRELRELLLHGVLHCLGYDHETDRGEMDRRELRLRRRWIFEKEEG